MDNEGEERDEFRSSADTRRGIATKTSSEENKSDKTTVAVTTQESLGGIRVKAMRIASLRQAAVQKNGPVQGSCGSGNETWRHCRSL